MTDTPVTLPPEATRFGWRATVEGSFLTATCPNTFSHPGVS
jgi:hypothetical protein